MIGTVAELRRLADDFAARHALKRPAAVGPQVLLADGFSAIEVDGRRLAVVGMILIGVVTLSAVHSLWWAIVPMIAGWVIWLATEAILAGFNIKLSLSGGPLVAQIIVLTMPAASHLAIHFRDDRRREVDPRRAASATLGSVWAPIAWTALTGAIGYGALVTSHVMPIRQFGAILGTCTFGAALLVMLISPIAMLPPFRMEIPVRHGSRSPVAGLMNRLVLWVYRRPLAIVVTVLAVVLPVACGLIRLSYETNYINLFRPETRVVGDYHTVESRLGGIGVVELVVPLGRSITPHALDELKAVEDQIKAIRVSNPEAVAQVLSLATVLDPDGRLAALPSERRSQIIADKLELIAASAQNELLPSFWNAETGDSRLMIRLTRTAARARQDQDFSHCHRSWRCPLRPRCLPDRAVALDDPYHRGHHRDPVGHIPLVGNRHSDHAHPGISQLLAGDPRHPADLAFSRPGSGAHGLAANSARHGDRLGGKRRPGSLGRRHVSLPVAVPPRRQDRALPQASL